MHTQHHLAVALRGEAMPMLIEPWRSQSTATPCQCESTLGRCDTSLGRCDAGRRPAMPSLCVTRLRHADAVLCYAMALRGFATPSRCTTSPCPCVTELCPCVSSACHAAAIRHIATPTLDRPLLCPRRPATPCRCSTLLVIAHLRLGYTAPRLATAVLCLADAPIRSCALPTLFLALACVQQPRGRAVRPPVVVVASS